MFRRPSKPLVDTGEDLGSLIDRAEGDAKLHATVGKVLESAVRRGARSTVADPGGGFVSADPVDNVTPPAPLPREEYEPPEATYIAPSRCDVRGYVAFTARGTYAAREYLKRVGGYWDAKRKRWLVPAEHGEYAAAVVEQAEMGRLPGADGGFTPKRVAPGLVCWVCGLAYSEVEFRARPGSRAEDWYCGCQSGASGGARRFRR
jgi:hypothetical protein